MNRQQILNDELLAIILSQAEADERNSDREPNPIYRNLNELYHGPEAYPEEIKVNQFASQNIQPQNNRPYFGRNYANKPAGMQRQGPSGRRERTFYNPRRAGGPNDPMNYMIGYPNDPMNFMVDHQESTYEQLLQLDEQNFNKGNGFKDADLIRLPTSFYVEARFREKTNCSICMTDFKLNEKVTELKCEHLYHESCIKEWLSRRKTCAVCKKDVKI